MNNENFGKILKSLRLKKNFTQDQLAEGICSKSHIARLESGSRGPSSYLIELISSKLGENLQDYIKLANYNDYMQVIDTISELNRLRKKKSYNELLELLNYNTDNSDFKTGLNLQFLLWNKGICYSELFNDFKTSYSFFLDALKTTHSSMKTKEAILQTQDIETIFLRPQELRIMNSICKLYYENNYKKQAVELCIGIEQKIMHNYYNYKTMDEYTFITYNLSKYLYYEKNYVLSLKYINNLIALLLSNSSLSLLGESYYHRGTIHYYLDDMTQCRNDFVLALSIFKITEKHHYIEIIRKDLTDKFHNSIDLDNINLSL